MKKDWQETMGQRIGHLRQARGWTQQALADRIAVSRVAVSHIEMDLSLPSERTVALLAGVFKIDPHALVAGTTYPTAKAERLPLVVCCHTELELQLALLDNDLKWLERLAPHPDRAQLAAELRNRWLPRLSRWQRRALGEVERAQLAHARQELRAAFDASCKEGVL